ncbi:NEDD4-binding protein 2 isoform X2 [Dunckerocampus dactyliophorus]|uniref:NEDD4-binding protein 2 isoform X2 n=1 Tax=Dunckerocampus dactyliophorus TaxID=161453 RepID=UPI00240600B3|nr:NEDD4-binding protein 2 isoform X2 [Dunckerocampus dactyliophorus]
MPRRKKNGQSPARVSDWELVGESLDQGYAVAMASNFPPSKESYNREKITQNMREMFSHLDPEVIHMVLAECDFKVESAMDALLELSIAAELAAPVLLPVSGFERTAAALLSPSHVSQPAPEAVSEQVTSPLSTSLLTEELDFQVEQELQNLTAPQEAGITLSLPQSQQVFPELLHFNRCGRGSPGHLVPSGQSSPIDPLRTQARKLFADFPHQRTEEPADMSQTSLNLASAERPSAFQMYKKNGSSHINSENAVGRAQMTATSWNLNSPAFFPGFHGNQRPCFITPAAPLNWPRQDGPPSPWRGQAPLRHSANIPTSRAMAAAAQPPIRSSRLRLEGRVLVLIRGAPGSGKTTLARAFVEYNAGAVALSTDDYFTRQGHYHFDPTALGEAHEWNHKRAKEAFERGANPIIIDNTNMQGWEMKPYVAQALKHNYKVLFREPDTWWKNKPRELQRRTKHNVPVETIRRMLNGYEQFVTVKSIMGSFMPEWKQRLLLENRSMQCVTPDAKCPDLVNESGLMIKSCRPHLYSSLPDVSSTGHFCEVGKLEDDSRTRYSVENYEHLDKDDYMDLGVLDSELDALNHPCGNQRIPDCIVESVMNHGRDEIPLACSESIKQSVPKSRKKCDFYETQSSDLIKVINQSGDLALEQGRMKEEEASAVGREEGEKSQILHFAGDSPNEVALEQRQERKERDEAGDGNADTGVFKEVNKDTDKEKAGPNSEFQKLLDLIQTGVVTCQSDSSSSSPLSLCHGQKLDTVCKIEEAFGCWSQSEERELNLNTAISSKGDLPDCVLDWKAADSYTDDEEVLKNETTVGVRKPDAAANSLWATEDKEIDDTEHEEDMKCKEQGDIEMTVQLDSSHSIGVCQAPEGSCVLSGDTQEPRQRQGRRSGKQCKLALTFTQNCSAPLLKTLECSSTTVQNTNYGQSHLITHPNCDTSFNPKPDLFTKPKEDIHLQASSPLCPDGGCPTQTEPQDFALLWRVNRQDNPPCTAVTACSYLGKITILCGDASRFVPELASAVSAAVAVHPSTQNLIPYNVVHEKGTQVEDTEFGTTQSRLESLSILSRHFKLVGFETLEDLYDKCQQDLEWTTNLLLDSGEKLFRVEDVLEERSAQVKVEETTTPLEKALETKVGDELPSVEPTDIVHILQQSACEALRKLGGTSCSDLSSFGGTASPVRNTNQFDTLSHTVKDNPSATALEKDADNEPKGTMEEWSVETEDDIASLDEVNRLLEELESVEGQKKEERSGVQERGSHVLNIQCVELKLPTELALQLTELFGPVGIEPGTCSSEDYAVQMDMNLAKLLHQKWKETIQERQREASISCHLPQNTPWSGSHLGKAISHLRNKDADSQAGLPVMDHWNFSQPPISLRNIMKEELVMQKNMEKSRQSRRDGASMLKEEQLYSRFPTIDRHFLQEIFRDHNYCLSQTVLFLNSLLDQEPVKTIVAPELSKSDHYRPASKEREQRQKIPDSSIPLQNYQDTEDPQYEDFRAEASLQRSRQLECFSKAAEAHKQGRKQVASFYALQGHLHGQKMYEANHRAAVQIFERVNSSLLPNNILDLHGLHVTEALEHLDRVLHDKKTDCEQGLCRPQLSVITGRGNHSQGGVARIRPAVINYLTKAHYRFTEPKPGHVLVSLK